MKRWIWLLIIIGLAVGGALRLNQPAIFENIIPVARPARHPLIKVAAPRPNGIIESPLVVTGAARGNWFFEASAPMVLTDWDGKIIAQSYIAVTPPTDWMTEDFVPFTGVLEFTAPEYGERGALILQKDNPSGLPEHDDAFEIPIRFDGRNFFVNH